SGPGHSELYQYHTLYGAPTLIRRTLDGTAYDFNMSYDAEGRLNVLTYPESSPGFRYAAQYFYNFSQPTQIRDASTSQVLYETWDVDGLGRETLTHRKSGVDTWRGFDKANGRLVYLNTYKGATNLQELSLAYDPVGNVTQRRDLKRG